MSRSSPPPQELVDAPPVRAEYVFLAIMATLTLLVLLSGVPLLPEPVAGDGSEALRHGWAESRRLDESEAAAAEARLAAHHDEQGLPTGRGRAPADR